MRRAPDRCRGRASSVWQLANPAETRSGPSRCLAEVRTGRGEQAPFDPIGSILGERQVREVGLADWEFRRSHAYVDHYKKAAGQPGRRPPRTVAARRGRHARHCDTEGVLICPAFVSGKRRSCPRSRSSVGPVVRVSCHVEEILEDTVPRGVPSVTGSGCRLRSGLRRLSGLWTRMADHRRFQCLRSGRAADSASR